jgi:hypothetical protein
VIKIPNPRKVVLKDHTGLTATKYQIVNKSNRWYNDNVDNDGKVIIHATGSSPGR